jgi:CHAT domain-containing protein
MRFSHVHDSVFVLHRHLAIVRANVRFIVAPLLLAVCMTPFGGCSREASPEEKEADLAFQRAQLALGQGRYHEARILLFSALPVDTRFGHTRRVAEEERMLGEIYGAFARFDSALVFYTRARDQLKSVADREAVRGLTLEIAALYRLMGSERTALSIYNEALRLADVFDDRKGKEQIQWAVLPTLRDLEETDEETQILTELLNLSTSSGDAGMQAKVYFATGLAQSHRRDTKGALENLLRALTLAEQARDSILAITVLSELGNLYDEMGKPVESFQSYAEGLQRTDVTTGTGTVRQEMLIRVGDVYVRERQFGEARRFYRAALKSAIEKGNKLAEGYLFVQLGHCDLPTSLESAVQNFQSALDLFQGVSYAPGSAYALYSLALASQKAGRLVDAVGYLKSAAEQEDASLWVRTGSEFFRASERAVLHSYRPSAYDAIIELLLQIGRNDEAFWYAERKNTRALFDQVSSLGIRTNVGFLDSLLERFDQARSWRIGGERQLAQMLAGGLSNRELLKEIQTSLGRAQELLEETGSRIVSADGLLQPAVGFSNVGVAEVQQLLPDGSALVFPVSTRRTLYTFVVTNRGTATAVAAASEEKVRAQIRRFDESINLRRDFADSSVAQVKSVDWELGKSVAALYGLFLQPVDRLLSSVDQIIIVPQPEFASIPMHALRRSAISSASPYLVERFSVRYLPTASALRFSRLRAQGVRLQKPAGGETGDVVAVGYSGGTRWDVEYELRDIRAFYKDARLFFNQQATLKTLQKERGKLLHLAAAFHESERTEGNAYVVLSDGKGINSMRRVLLGELCTIVPFPTVIISDVGKTAPRLDPLQPLLFLMNGSGTVILNGFATTRKAKKYFGEMFYTARLAGQTSQAAFRQAQLAMIKNAEYSSPFLWGGFFLWGE